MCENEAVGAEMKNEVLGAVVMVMIKRDMVSLIVDVVIVMIGEVMALDDKQLILGKREDN